MNNYFGSFVLSDSLARLASFVPGVALCRPYQAKKYHKESSNQNSVVMMLDIVGHSEYNNQFAVKQNIKINI